MHGKTAVIAIGGNSLIKDSKHPSIIDQNLVINEVSLHIANIVKSGWNVIIGHGNGPQVGFVLRRSELASSELPQIPLDACVANTQGKMGYLIQQNLINHFYQLGIDKCITTIITQVEVDPNDKAFKNPTKPIGTFMSRIEALRHFNEDGWNVIEDSGRGWRRVVPSPMPIRIVEGNVIKRLVDMGIVVIAVGGGGIPVVRDGNNYLRGIPAVIDKDYATAMLASMVGADLFMLCTSVDKVALNFGKPNQKWLDHLYLAQAKEYLAEGSHFSAGSMKPKIQAAVNYLEAGGMKAIITSPENMELALDGETGTLVTT
ncbi:MAG: carbamate kinase [Anaerolineaceae bacterium 4572_78]|nr:MAG: carbamate kinase [Anaerolineaceae bacterium 4572_78]